LAENPNMKKERKKKRKKERKKRIKAGLSGKYGKE